MNIYTLISKAYDLLDVTYFANKEKNPREMINQLIPNRNVRVLDMCCGTLSNTLAIAKKCKNAKILGIDASRQMLQVAHSKLKKEGLENVYIKCMDATSTPMKNECFDYIVIGLALHEMNPKLREDILKEAYRLLKSNGKLIILEWDEPSSILQRILYYPLLKAEQAVCKSFLDFYNGNKKTYFEKNHFLTCREYKCSYTVVMELEKM